MKLAPVPEIVRYLAIFHRAFKLVASYKDNKNPDVALLGGFLADALHNVPRLLQNYDEAEWYKPSEMDQWIGRGVPRMVRGYGAPVYVVTLCENIVSDRNCAQEIGLLADLSDLIIAPPGTRERYLSLLYQACVGIRVLRNYGNRGDSPWRDLKNNWTDRANERSLLFSCLAQALLPAIIALVQWDLTSDDTFQRQIAVTKTLVPERYRDNWEASFKPWNSV